MLRKEYEELMERDVADSEYMEANVVYENVGCDKEEFVKKWQTAEGARYFAIELSSKVNGLMAEKETLKDELESRKETMVSAAVRLIAFYEESYLSRDAELCEVAKLLMGEKEYILHKLEGDMDLTEADKELMKELIKRAK